jgi:hypothetical protein
VRAFWTILTSLLLAILPVGSAAISVQNPDTCSSCRCCVQTNGSPTSTRSAPQTETRSIRSQRPAQPAPEVAAATRYIAPTFHFKSAGSGVLRASPVPIFQRHCLLLI